MIRQTAFGIAISTIVLASGLISSPMPTHSSTNKLIPEKTAPISSNQLASSTNFNTRELEKSVFEKINQYRAARRLPKLSLDSQISKQARIHSQNMASGKVPFSHKGFEKRVNIIPIRYQSAAENVAFNQGYDNPAAEAVRGWIKSPDHLINIKGNYNFTGIGVAANKDGEVYLTQIFIRSR
ncbi:CAP domain-containing protein [Calothrix sp. UHCC 0171]|uniref:CAP domain-containing protein n=1 Tax=Calothrix sp. UHCC 0171 TaxID=3110245 RepID=UPI002B216276|nr:CAP domain-containing protein [Calothrix sp. UHCC 0171]MEA5569582.1 CAP domain-containing protein [Calothrix sp. UHCC 0171]